MIRAVLFDFGGVLTESGKRGFIADTLGELYGVSPGSLKIGTLHAALRRGRTSEQALFDELNTRYGKHVTREMFVDKVNAVFVPSHEVYDVAERLRRNGISTGILSNVFSMNGVALRDAGWYDGFEPILLSCDTGFAKPDKAFYELAIKELGLPAEQILFVDDQDKCLPPARELGMHVIQAINPQQIVADIETLIARENHVQL